MNARIRWPRIGVGFDVHAFAAGRRLVLGGVEIPYEAGLAGHSDADVLLHAVMDAMLGACAAGDIGEHFPPGDERWKNADSGELLRAVKEVCRGRGYVVGNLDVVVIAQRPRLSPYKEAMRRRIASLLGICVEQVGIKATTTEKLGFCGRGEGIAAQAVAAMYPVEGVTNGNSSG